MGKRGRKRSLAKDSKKILTRGGDVFLKFIRSMGKNHGS